MNEDEMVNLEVVPAVDLEILRERIRELELEQKMNRGRIENQKRRIAKAREILEAQDGYTADTLASQILRALEALEGK